jgi:putative transposase
MAIIAMNRPKWEEPNGWQNDFWREKRINFSTVFAGQAIGIKQVHDDIWLSFMDYDLGYFDLDTRALEPLANPLGPKVLPM